MVRKGTPQADEPVSKNFFLEKLQESYKKSQEELQEDEEAVKGRTPLREKDPEKFWLIAQDLEEALKNHSSEVQACLYANIARSTYQFWCKQYPDFLYRMQRAKQYPYLMPKAVTLKKIEQGDADLAFKFLKNVEPDVYHEKNTTDVNVTKDSAQDLADAMINEVANSSPVEIGETEASGQSPVDVLSVLSSELPDRTLPIPKKDSEGPSLLDIR